MCADTRLHADEAWGHVGETAIDPAARPLVSRIPRRRPELLSLTEEVVLLLAADEATVVGGS